MKHKLFMKLVLIIILAMTSNNHSQPFIYLLSKYEPDDRYSNIEKLDLSTGSLSRYIERAGRISYISPDRTNKWLFFQNRFRLEVVNCLNNSEATVLLDNVQATSKILYNDSLNQFVVLYESLNGSEGISLRFIDVNSHEVIDSLTNLELFDEENIYLSKDKMKLYFTVFDSLTHKRYLSQYSFIEKLITNKILLDSLGIYTDVKIIEDSNEDVLLLGFNYPTSSHADNYFQIYKLENNYAYSPIHYAFRSYGYLSSNAEYIIIQKSLWVQENLDPENFTGEIAIYNTTTGKFLRNLLLPPNGKIFLFDSYPDKLFYYVPETQQAIPIDLSKFENEFILNSLNPSTAAISTGPFELEVKGKGLDSLAVVYFNGQPKTTTFVSDSILTAEILAPDVSIAGTFPVWVKDEWAVSDTLQFTVQVSSPNLLVNLKSSTGTLLTTGSLQYYEGSWKDAVSNGDGTFTVITNQSNVSLRMTYEYGQQTVSSIPAHNNTYTFQTVNAQVQLRNSLGNFQDIGTVQYYAGAWRSFGTTTNGNATKELLPINYSFRMTYEFASIDKQQNLSVDPTVVFQTVNAAVQLKNSLGNFIDQGTVQYYSGAWRSFGTTTNGVAAKELLPINYSFRMTYEFASIDKQQNLSVDPTVVFQTVNAEVQLKNSLGNLIDVGAVQYYAGAWRSFGTTTNGVAAKELLPINYSFRMTYEYASIDKQQNLSVDPTVVFQTVNAQVQLKNSLGELMPVPMGVGTVQYYAGAWRSFGTTSNGVAAKELLPINYSFRMTHEFLSKDKQQNLSTNQVVEFTTVLCTVKVIHSDNQPFNNATVRYYAGSWRDLGITNSEGITTKELLPQSISFRASYGSANQDKQQDIGANSLVEILLNVP